MKNFKKISILAVLFICGLFGLFGSCSGGDEENISLSHSNMRKLQEGEIIAEMDSNGEFKFTISKDEIIKDFVDETGHTYSDVEIIKVEVNEDPNDVEYLLLVTSLDKRIKTAVSVTYEAESASLRLPNTLANAIKITCQSECQFGCTPTILKNPAGQKELTCIKCSDGKKCTKTVSL